MKVPKYVLKLLQDRTKKERAFSRACAKVDEYCESIGIDAYSDLIDDACLYSDIRIYCEVDAGYSLTLKAIEKQLERNKKNETLHS